MSLYTPKSVQVNFLWGKNDARTAVEQFYTQKNFYTPPKKNRFLATSLTRARTCLNENLITHFQSKQRQKTEHKMRDRTQSGATALP